MHWTQREHTKALNLDLTINKTVFDGWWSLSKEVYEYLDKRLPRYSRMLIIGSGKSTAELVKQWDCTVIEDDVHYARNSFIVAHNAARTIILPLVDATGLGIGHPDAKDVWYDQKLFRRAIEGYNRDGIPLEFDCVIVDGPSGEKGNRRRLMDVIDCLGQPNMWVVDDVQRDNERNLVYDIVMHGGGFSQWQVTHVHSEHKVAAVIRRKV